WLPVHFCNMISLASKHPGLAREFRKENFVVHKTPTFSSIPIDQACKQNNKCVKGNGGAVGLTENTSQLRWMVSGQEMARVIGKFRADQKIARQGSRHRHHKQKKGIQTTFSKQVTSPCGVIKKLFALFPNVLYVSCQVLYVMGILQVFLSYVKTQLQKVIVGRHGKVVRRCVQPNTRLPGNWSRRQQGETVPLPTIAEQAVTIEYEEQKVVSIHGKVVLYSSARDDVSDLSPCTHEEADTRLLLHVADCGEQGHRRIMLRTVGTDVIVLAVSMHPQLNVSEPWVAFGGQVYTCTDISQSIGPEKSRTFPVFNAFSGCDQTSFLNGKDKRTAW
uniref:Uncharacterized protein n=1 Tax=Latimeria chalumnae TaxID=7897 RepID=H3ADC0_LATCH